MSVVYHDYIASDAWKQRRVAALNRSSSRVSAAYLGLPRCEFCGQCGTRHKNSRSRLDFKARQFRVEQSNGLHVHHVTYERLGDEHPDDLIVLCTDICYYDDYDRRYRAWSDRTRKFVGESEEQWRAKRKVAGPPPSPPDRIGCHERVHDDPQVRAFIAAIARSRTY